MSHALLKIWIATAVFACLSVTVARAQDPVSLFDGKSLDGWEVLGCEAEVQDKMILLKAGNGLVQTKQEYSDYVLTFEWKALKSDAWDSGIYFRYKEVPPGRPWPNKYQVNLRKDMEGDLVGFADGKSKVSAKPGDWNRFELTVKGTRASLKVNGKPSWEVDGIQVPSGFIALQAEIPGGGQFQFRNIQILELKD